MRPLTPCGDLKIGHSSMMCSTVCGFPHSQRSVADTPIICRYIWVFATPERSLLRLTQAFRSRSHPGGLVEGVLMNFLNVDVDLDHCLSQQSLIHPGCGGLVVRSLLASVEKCLRFSLWWPYSAGGGIRLVGSSAPLQASLKVRKLRRSSGGGMPDSMGRDSTGVDGRAPLISLMAVFSTTSIEAVWLL